MFGKPLERLHTALHGIRPHVTTAKRLGVQEVRIFGNDQVFLAKGTQNSGKPFGAVSFDPNGRVWYTISSQPIERTELLFSGGFLDPNRTGTDTDREVTFQICHAASYRNGIKWLTPGANVGWHFLLGIVELGFIPHSRYVPPTSAHPHAVPLGYLVEPNKIPLAGILREVEPAHAEHFLAVSTIFTDRAASAVNGNTAKALRDKAAAHARVHAVAAHDEGALTEFRGSAATLQRIYEEDAASTPRHWSFLPVADALVWFAHGRLRTNLGDSEALKALASARTIYTELGDTAGLEEVARVPMALLGYRVWQE